MACMGGAHRGLFLLAIIPTLIFLRAGGASLSPAGLLQYLWDSARERIEKRKRYNAGFRHYS